MYILFFVIKSSLKQFKFFYGFTDSSALLHFLIGTVQHIMYLVTLKGLTFITHRYSMLFRAGQEHKATGGMTSAAGTFYFFICYDMVSPTCLVPKLCRLMKFFRCFGQKSRTHRAVIAAYRDNRLPRHQLFVLINIPFHFGASSCFPQANAL